MITYTICLINIALLPFLIYFTVKNDTKKRFIFKMLMSLNFSLIALTAFLSRGRQCDLYILTQGGLICSFCGDYLLGKLGKNKKSKVFVFGVIAFTVTHLFYIIMFLRLGRFSPLGWIFPASIVLYIFFARSNSNFDFQKMLVPVLCYGLVIAIMLASALGYYIHPVVNNPMPLNGIARCCLIAGACLFAFSDFTLMHVYFYKHAPIALKPLYVAAYNIGQMLIALSVLFY